MRKIVSLLAVIAVTGALACWLWPRSHLPTAPKSIVADCKEYKDDKGKKVKLHERAFADRTAAPAVTDAANAVGKPDRLTYHLGCAKSWVWEFRDNLIVDVDEDDIFVFERGNDEPTRVYVSNDGKYWDEIGIVTGGKSSIDLNRKGQTFRFIRLTDLTDRSDTKTKGSCRRDEAGADIDAVATYGYSWVKPFDETSKVFFKSGSSVLSDEGKGELKRYFEQIEGQAFARLDILGHTDTKDTEEKNLDLSERRAGAVADFLVAKVLVKGVDVRTFGYGETRLAKQTPDNTDEPANRRVELIFIPAAPCPQPKSPAGSAQGAPTP